MQQAQIHGIGDPLDGAHQQIAGLLGLVLRLVNPGKHRDRIFARGRKLHRVLGIV